MSGLEALGVACNIMQVISFAHETINFCKEIYQGRSFNEYNQQSVVSLVELSAQLQTHFQQAKSQSAKEKRLSDIAQKCNVAARALEDEVKFLTSHHAKGNLAATIKTAVKANWRKNRLERLEKSLENYQNTMESHLLARVCTQGDAIEIQQSQGFEKLGKDVQYFTSQYAAGHTRIVDLIKTELVLVRAEAVKATLQSEESIKMHVTSTTNNLIQRMDQCTIESNVKSSTKEQQDRFLNSLRYEGMNQRKNDITSSLKDTFQWIFDSDCGETPIQLWDNFGDWLKSDSNIYWIAGKPGSGKSTLMKYLLKSPSTKAALKIWNTDPIILSHFLWKPGFKMQKSVKGFLCSILHQALLSDRISLALGSILETSKPLLLKQEAADWDVEELKDLSFTILGSDMFPVCIFLDGLDEICEEDGPFSLLKLIDDLRTNRKVKICVSSRPEPVLQYNLCRHQQLRLHDLTRNDMKKFAAAQVRPYVNRGMITKSFGSEITSSLIEKAEGVFLWLHLASRSLIGGIENGDTEDILMQRLEEMPNELMKLYSDMWKRVNGDSKIYREAAARYFNLLILDSKFREKYGYSSDFRIRFFQLMGATQTKLQDIILEKQSSVSVATLEQTWAVSVKDIQVRCAGLLEVNYRWDDCEFWEVRDPNHYEFIRVQQGNPWVQFIHRTAYDFITDTEEGHRIRAYDSSSSEKLYIQLVKGHLIMAKFLRGHNEALEDVLRYLSEIKDLSLQPRIYEILRHVWAWYHERNYRIAGEDSSDSFCTGPHFLALLTESIYRNFILSTIKGSSNPSSLATHVLRNIHFSITRGDSALIERLDCFLESLLALGADATSRGPRIKLREREESGKEPVPFVSPFASFIIKLFDYHNIWPEPTVRLLETFMNVNPDLQERVPLIVEFFNNSFRIQEHSNYVDTDDFFFFFRLPVSQDYELLHLGASHIMSDGVSILLNISVGFLLDALLMRGLPLETGLRDGQASRCQSAQLVLIYVNGLQYIEGGNSISRARFRPIDVKVTERLLSLLLQFLCGTDLSSDRLEECTKVIRDICDRSPNYEVVHESGRSLLAEEDCGYRYEGPEDNHFMGDEWTEHWPEVCSDISSCAEESDVGSL
ncbi:hypothetical protein F5Y00DRAFT_257063 [Daldinia vernicosa]|uniref:uncharacterized protein n=1 Tax=Daldinia vernicosa TaxID=114800 RepID=UPI00200833CA|nr:uncharacterized protein F5Y00DRAFT_257063 [Daldinia vernicosa]KAI0853761.1 hypothetical protein F5Y00DRAFT_257063 [Daldinia vernicosa]